VGVTLTYCLTGVSSMSVMCRGNELGICIENACMKQLKRKKIGQKTSNTKSTCSSQRTRTIAERNMNLHQIQNILIWWSVPITH